jgi:type VI secretion system protein ImpJ
MTQLGRVVWSEGMHLAQHHFQVQSRYFEDSISFALSHLFFRTYGVVGCELDADALRNGTISLVHARGTMPDGLAFHFPDGDQSPDAREIRDIFSPTQESHLVLLTIPPYRRGQSNCAEGTNGDRAQVRYVSQESAVLDETTGQDEKVVILGRKNFRLMLDAEPHEDLVTLPLARVRRDGTGHFVYDPEYIPPCLQIGASTRLLQVLSRVVEILETKSDAMAVERKSASKSMEDFAAGEVANFWLSHTIHAGLAPLRHHLQSKRTHPEQLFTDFSRLAGALCTFSLDAHPRTLPVYDHDKLDECFNELDRHIRANLQVVAPTNCIKVELKSVRKFLHTGVVADKRCFGSSQWILGVRSDLSEPDVVKSVPRLVKVCSAKHIARLVKEALAGLTVEHLPVPPAAVSPRPGTQYFAVTRSGPCWETTVQTEEVGIYVPEPLSGSQLELLIVLES